MTLIFDLKNRPETNRGILLFLYVVKVSYIYI